MKINHREFQECIRHLYCMNSNDFLEVFGTGALGENYYWEKFKNEFKGDVAKFITYLDHGNLALLWEHFQTHLNPSEPKEVETRTIKSASIQWADEEPVINYELTLWVGESDRHDVEFISFEKHSEALEAFIKMKETNPNDSFTLFKWVNDMKYEIEVHN